MVERDNRFQDIKGAEAIVVHNGNIVLGMQSPKRWYNLENGEKACIIKTLGGKIEKEDENSSKRAVIREILEEVRGIEFKDIRVTTSPIFKKKIKMRDLNPFEKESTLGLEADFYLLEILNKNTIMPNDLPALLEIPFNEFIRLKFAQPRALDNLQRYLIKNDITMPQQYALMIPEEVRDFLLKLRRDLEDIER